MNQTDWIKLATAGRTIDGREIKAEWLAKMAELYSPDLYVAGINAEHFMFPGLGYVTELEARNDEQGRPALYGKLAITDTLKQMAAEGRKLFRSIEPIADFPKEGDTYLAALAVTDLPASQGLQPHEFSAQRSTMGLLREASEAESELHLSAESAPRQSFWERLRPFARRPQTTQESEEMTPAEQQAFQALQGQVEQLTGQIAEMAQHFAAQPPEGNGAPGPDVPEAEHGPESDALAPQQFNAEALADKVAEVIKPLADKVEQFEAFMAETRATETREVTAPAGGNGFVA